VVVVQGTDPIEEVAYALHLLGSTGLSFVVTEAMRHASSHGADGPANLADAIATAAEPRWRDLGVPVVLGGTIHSAGLARKGNTALPDAFVSWPGPLGVVHEGRVRLDLVAAQRPPRIEISRAQLGGPRLQS
jgi:L-asparaginase